VIVKLIAITARLPRSRIRTRACNGVTHERYNGSCNWLRDRVRRFVQKARRGVYSPGSGIVDSALSSIAAIPTKSSCKNGRWLLVAIGDCDPRADSKPRLAEFLRFLLFESRLRISVPLTPRVLNDLRVSEFRGLRVSPMSLSMSIRSSFFFFFLFFFLYTRGRRVSAASEEDNPSSSAVYDLERGSRRPLDGGESNDKYRRPHPIVDYGIYRVFMV